MAYINTEVQITKEQAHHLLMGNKSHYLWNKPYRKWSMEDYNCLINGVNKAAILLNRYVAKKRVTVTFFDGKTVEYESITEAAKQLNISQPTLSNLIAGRKKSKRILSIQKAD